jgi:threonine dehydrogenase-like Zn-dependent dehydrogenase
MKAVLWRGKENISVEHVPDPVLRQPTDAIVRVMASGLCGSDLHLYGGLIPGMRSGDVLGHEAFGVVEEVGADVKHIRPGSHVAVPFNISCGRCFMCLKGLHSQCETTQNTRFHRGGSLFGYTHLYGGIPGAQAEFLRVPMAHFGPIPVPEGTPPHRAVLLADVLPTARQGVVQAGAVPGQTVAVFGLGPIGQMCARFALRAGADRVIGVDPGAERLRMAQRHGVDVVDLTRVDNLPDVVAEATSGRGADSVIECVGMEAVGSRLDRMLQVTKLQPSRAIALRHAVDAVRRGGTISVVGVYGGWIHAFPIDQIFDKQISLNLGQANVRRWTDELLPLVTDPDDPLGLDDLVTHGMSLDDAPAAYRMFRSKDEGAVKVVFQP